MGHFSHFVKRLSFVNCYSEICQWLDLNTNPLVLEATSQSSVLLTLPTLCSVTQLGDLLDFGQLFEAFGKNYFAQISHILRQFL